MKRILFALLAVLTAFSVYLTAPKLDAMNVAESPGWYAVKQSNVIDEVTDGDKVYPIAQNNNYYSSTNGFRTNRDTFVTKWDTTPSYFHVYHTIKLDNTIDKLYVTKTDGTVIFEIDVNMNLDYTKGDHITAGIRWDKVNGVDKTRFYYEFNGETVESSTTVKEYKLYYTLKKNDDSYKVFDDHSIIKVYNGKVFELRDGNTYFISPGNVHELNLGSKIDSVYGNFVYRMTDGRYLNIGHHSSQPEITLEADIEQIIGSVYKLTNGTYMTMSGGTLNEITLEADIEQNFGNVYKLTNGTYVTISGSTLNEITLEADIEQNFSFFYKLTNGTYVTISGSTVTELEIPEFTKVTKLYYSSSYPTDNPLYKKIDYIEKGTAIDASFEEDKPTTLINKKGFSHYSLTKDGTKLPIGTVLVEDFTVHSVLKDVKIPIKVHIDNQVDTLYYYDGDVIELETPVKDGYLFKHWSLKPDGPEASLVAGNTYTNVPKEFYAVWDKTYTVTFVNGYDIHAEQIVVENQRVTAPETPMKQDSKFVGWYKDQETTEVFKITDVITEDTILYAKFTSSDQGGGIIPTPKPGNLTNSDLILIGVGSVVLLLAVVVFFNRKK